MLDCFPLLAWIRDALVAGNFWARQNGSPKLKATFDESNPHIEITRNYFAKTIPQAWIHNPFKDLRIQILYSADFEGLIHLTQLKLRQSYSIE